MHATEGDIRLLTDCGFSHAEMYDLVGGEWEGFENAAIVVIVAEKDREGSKSKGDLNAVHIRAISRRQ